MPLLAAIIILLSFLSTFWMYSLYPVPLGDFDAHLQIHVGVQAKEMHSQDARELPCTNSTNRSQRTANTQVKQNHLGKFVAHSVV